MEKLDKVIAGLSCCGSENGGCACEKCPYDGRRESSKVCLDLLQEDAIELLELKTAEIADLRKDKEVLLEDLSDCMDECHRLARELREAHEKLSWLEENNG